jgi:NAD(P)H-hydrate epimerase
LKVVLTADEMRRAEARAIAEASISGMTLMENAGVAAARAIEDRWGVKQRVAVVCGRGNNGGDGLVVARVLKSEGTRVFIFAKPDEMNGDAAAQLEALGKLKRPPKVVFIGDEGDSRRDEIARASLIVDALCGTGGLGPPRPILASAISAVRAARTLGSRVVSLDLPSGLPADSAAVPGWPVVEADLTIAFAALKPAVALAPARDLAGDVVVAPIGIPFAFLAESGSRLAECEGIDAAVAFPARPADSHKGTFGHVFIVAGSEGKSGAAILAARGALRAGAGLITVASVRAVVNAVAAAVPEAMTLNIGDRSQVGGGGSLEAILREADGRHALLIGPGLGRSRETQELVEDLAARAHIPLVLDADALFSLRVAAPSRIASRGAPTFLTPHAGEMARMRATGAGGGGEENRVDAVREAAQAFRAHVALKGRRTLVADPSGRITINPTGSPALATAGTGDVLAGVVAAVAARTRNGLDPHLGLVGASWVHGVAGESAGRGRPWGVTASDIAERIPRAIATLRRFGSAARSRARPAKGPDGAKAK